ncbi:MAG: hypothetical protein AAGI66_09280 [Cyanobacteria bacterium P01_H01_bin.74]
MIRLSLFSDTKNSLPQNNRLTGNLSASSQSTLGKIKKSPFLSYEPGDQFVTFKGDRADSKSQDSTGLDTVSSLPGHPPAGGADDSGDKTANLSDVSLADHILVQDSPRSPKNHHTLHVNRFSTKTGALAEERKTPSGDGGQSNSPNTESKPDPSGETPEIPDDWEDLYKEPEHDWVELTQDKDTDPGASNPAGSLDAAKTKSTGSGTQGEVSVGVSESKPESKDKTPVESAEKTVETGVPPESNNVVDGRNTSSVQPPNADSVREDEKKKTEETDSA